MKPATCIIFTILTIVLSVTGYAQSVDSARYVVYVQKRSLTNLIREGNRVKLKLYGNTAYSKFYRINKITKESITYGPDLQVAPGEIQAVRKKKNVVTSIFGTALIVGGFAVIASGNPFGSNEAFYAQIVGGLVVSAIGIGVVIPPTYKKEKGIIEIRRINR